MLSRFKTIEHWLEDANQPALVACAAVAVVVLLIGGWAFAANVQKVEEPQMAVADETISDLMETTAQADAEIDSDTDAALDPQVVADDARSALDAASGTEEVNRFNASTGVAQTLDAQDIPDVQNAIAAYYDEGYEVGFVVYDLATGEGLGYNADERFFAASTVKAPFVAFAAQSMVDDGQASFDEEVFEDMVLDGTGVMSSDNVDLYDLRTVMSNTIVYSDNTGYGLLRERFDQGGFEAWCAAAGVNAVSWDGEWYPYYSPRDLAKLWLNVGAYVARGEGSAPWLADLLSQTNSSFLREALGERNQVLSKPGYEIDTAWYDMGALNDAGLVLGDSDAYVIVIMSDADYDDEYFTDNEPLIVDLAAALGAAHDRMLLERGTI